MQVAASSSPAPCPNQRSQLKEHNMAREKETRRVKTKARILLVEDHAMVRFGLTQLINQQADLAVCGEADSVPGALEAVATLKPDLAIVDLTLKGSNGLELIKTLAAQYPKLSVLVVSMHDESKRPAPTAWGTVRPGS